MKACVLVAVEKEPSDMAEVLRHFHGVLDSFPVLGRKEVVLRVELRDMVRLADLLEKVSEVRGVIVSETLLEVPQVKAE